MGPHSALLRIARWLSAACAVALAVATTMPLHAEDWPEFRGRGRAGVWNETGILETFPAGGLEVLWRTPVRAGYSGPAVADGRVFLLDFIPEGEDEQVAPAQGAIGGSRHRLRGTERALALDEKTGRILWTQSWDVDYGGIMWAIGPRATPTVDADRVYTVGATGRLLAMHARTGAILWQKDFQRDFGANRRMWAWDYGFASSPIVDGPRLIAMVGGKGNAMVVAFDKMTGRELWRAIESNGEVDLGVAQPILVDAGGTRQLIIWLPEMVHSLNPATGREHWRQPFHVYGSMTVPTPVVSGRNLFFTNFYNGPLMLELDGRKPAARVVWKGKSGSEIDTDGLHGVVTTPVIVGDHIYGICSYGQFRCLRMKTGERVWETFDVTRERARWASGQIIRQGDRLFVNNDRGELIIMKPSPEGYREISRTPLIAPTSPPFNRRQLEVVSWSHPAYANRNIYVRNDREIVCASLAADATRR
jgi:outer membrane protein assembly factor BamB